MRESDLALMTKAGTEIGVASTKAFTTQLTVLLMLVARPGRLKGMAESVEQEIVHGLQALPARIEQMLSMDKEIEALAEGFSDKHHALFLGRGDQYPIAMEGALKLKEISYIHAEAYAAGELKHGPLALIDADMPVIVVAPNNELLEKLKSNIEEVRARRPAVCVRRSGRRLRQQRRHDHHSSAARRGHRGADLLHRAVAAAVLPRGADQRHRR